MLIALPVASRRPAGEKLGYLPGDMTGTRSILHAPLYDALNDLARKQLAKRSKKKDRDRTAGLMPATWSNAFGCIDRAQNATSMQIRCS